MPEEEHWWTKPENASHFTSGDAPVRRAPEVKKPEPVQEEDSKPPPEKETDRRKTLIVGAVGAVLAGLVIFTVMPDGDTARNPGPVASELNPEDFPPPAGEAPQEAAGEVPLTGEGPAEAAAPVERSVRLTTSPAGRGDTGALVKVTIQNDTESTVTVMSSLLQGDGRSAMVGEGTLAPGSRRIDPGETVQGTVEFVTSKPPTQIVLTDLSGEVVASS